MKRQGSALKGPANKKAKTRYEQYLQSIARQEAKKEFRKTTDFMYTDVTAAAGGVSSSGTVVSLFSSIARGDAGINNISGNMLNPTGLRLKYYWYTNQSYNTARVLVVQWFDQTAPTLASLLQVTTTGQGVISPLLYVNIPQAKVLYDKTHIIAPTAGDAAVVGYGTAIADVYIPGRRMKQVKFSGGASPVPVDGGLYMLLLSDDTAPTYPECVYYSRITYSD